MKIVRSTIIAGALAFAMIIIAPIAVHAQTDGKEMFKNTTPQQRADMQNKMMKDELNLTDTQYAQVSKLNLEYAQKMQPIIQSDDSRFSRMRKAKSIMGEKDKKLKAILTQEQHEKYEEVVKAKIQALKNYKKDKE
ncbi:MAG: hypothetical protein ABIN95_13035 [Mucilaginibacter sp.]